MDHVRQLMIVYGNTVQEDEEIRAEMNLTTKNSANVTEYVYFCI